MKVYAAGERVQTLSINPAAHIGDKAACPVDWFDESGEPKGFTIVFQNGEAEVDDQIGRYLMAHKLARKTKLIVPGLVAI